MKPIKQRIHPSVIGDAIILNVRSQEVLDCIKAFNDNVSNIFYDVELHGEIMDTLEEHINAMEEHVKALRRDLLDA